MEIPISGDDPHCQPEAELLMPFLATRTNGGNYDDDGFVAGFSLGQVYESLSHGRGWDQIFQSDLVPTLDLIAMRFGASIVTTELPDGWHQVTISPKQGD